MKYKNDCRGQLFLWHVSCVLVVGWACLKTARADYIRWWTSVALKFGDAGSYKVSLGEKMC